jgi:hypothetical protein
MYGPFLEHPDMDPAATALYRDAFARWQLLREFTYSTSPPIRWILGDDLGVHSPVVRIYRPAAS